MVCRCSLGHEYRVCFRGLDHALLVSSCHIELVCSLMFAGPRDPAAETAIRPQIWCSQSWFPNLSSYLEECFFTDTGMITVGIIVINTINMNNSSSSSINTISINMSMISRLVQRIQSWLPDLSSYPEECFFHRHWWERRKALWIRNDMRAGALRDRKSYIYANQNLQYLIQNRYTAFKVLADYDWRILWQLYSNSTMIIISKQHLNVYTYIYICIHMYIHIYIYICIH